MGTLTINELMVSCCMRRALVLNELETSEEFGNNNILLFNSFAFCLS